MLTDLKITEAQFVKTGVGQKKQDGGITLSAFSCKLKLKAIIMHALKW